MFTFLLAINNIGDRLPCTSSYSSQPNARRAVTQHEQMLKIVWKLISKIFKQVEIYEMRKIKCLRPSISMSKRRCCIFEWIHWKRKRISPVLENSKIPYRQTRNTFEILLDTLANMVAILHICFFGNRNCIFVCTRILANDLRKI